MTQGKTKFVNYICFLLFMVLGTTMFYFIDGGITIGGFGFMYHYLYGAGIVVIAFFLFLFLPDTKVFKDMAEITVLLCSVYFILTVWSFMLYAINFEDSSIMTKGIFQNVYIILAVFVAAASWYMFREKTILYASYAMGLANIIIIIPVFASDPGEFISELISLVVTFGNDTGHLMKSIEIHDLTFAFGLIFLYALIDKHVYGRKQVLVITAIFSITGLKRIAVAGIVLGVLLYVVLDKVKSYKALAYTICAIVIAATFAYLCAVHAGLYDYLELIGLDTKGRDLIYSYVNQLFYIGPGYLGNGIGYSSKAWDLPIYSSLVQDAYHCEFLRMYVEIGFSGYFAWIFLHLPFRIGYLFNRFSKHSGLVYLAAAAYCYITYATDNTYYYYYLNLAVFLVVFSAACGRRKKWKS